MKINICLTIICISFFQIAFSQTNKVDVIWGPTHEKFRTEFISLYYCDEPGIHAVKLTKEGYSLEYYDNELKLMKSESLPKYYYFSPVIDNVVWRGYSEYNEDKSIKKRLLQKYKKNLFEKVGEPKEVVKFDMADCEGFTGVSMDLEFSKDTTKIFIGIFYPLKNGEQPDFGLKVFDKKMELLWEKEKTKLCEENNLYAVYQSIVDNDGNVHLLLKVYHDEREEKKDKESNYHFSIISYYNNGEERVEYPIVSDKYLANMQLTINDKNELICTGFCFDTYNYNKLYNLQGYCFYKIDINSKSIVLKRNNEFDPDYIEQNYLNRSPFECYDQLLLCEDGGIICISEQYTNMNSMNFNTSASGRKSNTTSGADYYGYIFIIKYTSNGEVEWKNVIYKLQKSESYIYLPYFSYATHITDDKIYFLVNDHVKSFEAIKPKEYYSYEPSDMKNSMVVLYELSMDGKLKKEALFESDFPFIMNTYVSKQITEDEFLIYGAENKKLNMKKLGKLTFE